MKYNRTPPSLLALCNSVTDYSQYPPIFGKFPFLIVMLQGVQEKLCVFWLVFCCTIAAECWRGRGGKFSRILEKNTIFYEHPVPV